MRFLLCTIFLFCFKAGITQDTTFYDVNFKKVADFQSCNTYAVVFRDAADTNKVVEYTYYKSGQIKSEINYKSYSNGIRDGYRKEWYETGQLKLAANYINDLIEGRLISFWENGQLKRDDLYANGKLIKGNVWFHTGKELPYYDFFTLPEFPGGIDALVRYLSTSIIYPKEASRNGESGKVIVSFIVEKDGSISSIKVAKNVSKSLDEEAVRVISKMPKWKPGMEDGEYVRVKFNLPVSFKIKD